MELFLNFSYRLAQAAVNIALPKLKKLDVATRRPDDYFAEMVKTDDHMQRVGVRQEIPSLLTSCSCEERGGWRGRERLYQKATLHGFSLKPFISKSPWSQVLVSLFMSLEFPFTMWTV